MSPLLGSMRAKISRIRPQWLNNLSLAMTLRQNLCQSEIIRCVTCQCRPAKYITILFIYRRNTKSETQTPQTLFSLARLPI